MTDRPIQSRPGPSTSLGTSRLIAAICCSLALLVAAPLDVAAQSNSIEKSPPSSIASPAPAPITGVLADAIRDFRHLPTWTNVAILAAGGIGASFAHTSDTGVTKMLSGSNSMGSFFRIGETVGGARAQFAAALGTYAIGHISGNNRWLPSARI